MRIVLLEHPRSINPERCNDIANTPLSSCLISGYAAATLKSRGHDVEIIEGHMDKLSYAEIAQKVLSMKPDIIGVHMIYHWRQDKEVYAFLENMKRELNPHITIYGFYPTFSYEDILKTCRAVDSVILGEAEATFAELAETLQKNGSPEEVNGIGMRDANGTVHCLLRGPVEDLDSLPFPLRTEGMYRIPEVNIQGSRGCYGACVFCCINPFYGQGSKWRGRSPENIVQEIDQVTAETGRKDFYFTDPNFFGPGQRGQERVLRLASLLKQRSVTFGIEGRVNDIHEKTIEALVNAGLRNILIGMESGRDDSLRRMNKMTTVAHNENALKFLRKYGIEPNVGFIMFEPDSSVEDIRTNFEFLRRNSLLEHLPTTANVLYHFQIVLKGTPAYQALSRTGRLEPSPWSEHEGSTSFLHANVAVLASAMRDLTNFIFHRMNAIWSENAVLPLETNGQYKKVNGILVDTFESLLTAVEEGQTGKEEVDSTILGVIGEIDEILGHTK